MGYSITQLREEYAEGSLTPTDAVEACFRNIEELDPQVRAWQSLYQSAALLAAQDSTQRLHSGASLGPFDGVPFALKDILEIEGEVTTAGCAEWIERRSTTTAEVAKRLLRSGGILLGKTKTVEFAMGGWGTNQRMGTPHNPWDDAVQRTPGGSSSGSGASVADFMVPLALGSQTGGSMLRPASFCGVYGYKPTFGSISRHGVFPLVRALDHIGVYGRSLRDIAMIGDVLMIYDTNDFDMRKYPAANLVEALSTPDESPPRLAFVKGPPWLEAEPYLDEVFERYISGLGGIPEVILGGIFDRALDAQAIVMNANIWTNLKEYSENHEDELQEETVRRITAGREISAADYIAASELRSSLVAALGALFENYDAIITASAPGEAPMGLKSTGNAVFQRIWTFTGLPTISLPLMKGPNEMPIGVQIIGPKDRDDQLIKAARWIEEKS